MPWLFKDPIVTMAWLNFDHARSNSKNSLKRSNYPKLFFFSKNTYKIFMYLSAPFILQNFKKYRRHDPELSGEAFFGPKMAYLSWTKLIWWKPFLLLSSTYWPFSLCKILKKFLKRIQSYEDAPFLGQKWSVCPKQNFFGKNY